jgi:hypothetical protein
MEQVKSNFELMHGNCYRSQNLSSKFLPYLHQQLGETKVCALCIPRLVNNERAMRVLLATPPICSFSEMRAMHLLIAF